MKLFEIYSLSDLSCNLLSKKSFSETKQPCSGLLAHSVIKSQQMATGIAGRLVLHFLQKLFSQGTFFYFL